MPKLILALILVLAACSSETGPVEDISTTDPPGIPTPVITGTSEPDRLELELQDCSTPPVTFSALCEIYELLQAHHVDRPIDPDALAEVATRALDQHESPDTAPLPRRLFCAIPDSAFGSLCEVLTEKMIETGLPPGPAVDAAVTAMVDVGVDPFTFYVPPGQASSVRANGIVGGIGVLLDATDPAGSKCRRVATTCPLEIVFVLESNPGAAAGLEAGDVIVEIDGEPVNGMGFGAVAAAIAGDESGTVELTIARNGSMLNFLIERSELVVPTVEIDTPRPGIGYLRIPDFEVDIPALVDEGLDILLATDPSTIVIDLRDNPGGLLDSAVEVASRFIDEGTVVMETMEPGETFVYSAMPGAVATDQDLIVLVNEGTASAAEILAGALREQRGAVLVGTPTFGKAAVQIPFSLRNGGQLFVVVARWVTPSGSTVESGGLPPDHLIEWPKGSTVEEAIDAALDAVS